ncbi:MAG: NlpC/P60 family protein [Rothia sp. (in: high G+C Gram-positive bacteria)]|nr:NlpC/P60 family protein [Rothia sp. (in: high G+C Gram-positive bacteria)]
MRRSLSVGAVGVILAGSAFAAANATDEAPETTVNNGAVTVTPTLKSLAVAGEGKVGLWGVPAYVIAPEKPVESTPVVEEEAPIVEEVAVEAPAEAVAVEEVAAPEVAPLEVAPQAEAIEVIEATPAPVEPVAAVAPAPTEASAPAAPVAAAPAAAPAPALSTAANSGKRDAVVAAAMAAASVNAQTDCTMLATNALSAAGINFHGWPMDYMALGTVTGNPQPGDLVLYQSNGFGQQHIAVYIGNGQAVHGGWNGMGTSVFSVNLPTASAPIFVSPAGL